MALRGALQNGTMDKQGDAAIADAAQVWQHIISVGQDFLTVWHQLLCTAHVETGNYCHECIMETAYLIKRQLYNS